MEVMYFIQNFKQQYDINDLAASLNKESRYTGVARESTRRVCIKDNPLVIAACPGSALQFTVLPITAEDNTIICSG